MIHLMKIKSTYYYSILSGEKTFEIRQERQGRKFTKGDILVLNRLDYLGKVTNEGIVCEVCYKTSYGQTDDYVVLGIKNVAEIGGER